MSENLEVTVRVEQSISAIDRKDWDACANPDKKHYNPFVAYDFLRALEDSAATTAETGWHPQHLVLFIDNRMKGAMPCYMKSHSQGEYVFDYAWADAYERAGGDYYPKLQSAIPFTPVTGPRLLVRPDQDAATSRAALAQAGSHLTDKLALSSLHITFLTQEEWKALDAQRYLKRRDKQFHWRNQNFSNFDDFLETLSSRKRKDHP